MLARSLANGELGPDPEDLRRGERVLGLRQEPGNRVRAFGKQNPWPTGKPDQVLKDPSDRINRKRWAGAKARIHPTT